MKTFILLLCSTLIAFSQAPPIQRTSYTTNGQVAADNAARAAVPTNNPIFTGNLSVPTVTVGSYVLMNGGSPLYFRNDSSSFIAFGVSDDLLYKRHGIGTAGLANASSVSGTGSLLASNGVFRGEIGVAGGITSDSLSANNVTSQSLTVNSGATLAGGVGVTGAFTVQGGPASFDTSIQLTPGAAAGRVLTSDATGLGSWQNAPVPPMNEGGNFAVDDFSDYTVGQNNFSLNGGYGWGTNFGVMSRGTNTLVLATNPWSRIPANKLRVNRGGFTRRMPWGSDWSWIRMAVLLRFPTNFVGTNDFTGITYLGVCNDTNGFPTNHTGVAASSLTNVPVWWGVQAASGGTASTWQYRALANSSNTYILPTLYRFLNVTNNIYTTVSPSGGPAAIAGRDEGYYTWLFFTTARTAVTNAGWVTGYSGADTTSFPMVRPTMARAFQLLSSLVSATKSSSPILPDLAAAGTEATYIIPSFYGEFDSINFAWSNPGTNSVEVAGYAVMKMQ